MAISPQKSESGRPAQIYADTERSQIPADAGVPPFGLAACSALSPFRSWSSDRSDRTPVSNRWNLLDCDGTTRRRDDSEHCQSPAHSLV